MKATIISIGNSKGVRIPKTVLEQCGFKESVNMIVKNHTLVLIPIEEKSRKDWGIKFKQMHQQNDDVLLDPVALDHSWDQDEWEW
ncbi:MAG: AbrB/MazE/SpoVT family DNA-binding domain-containing protein [Proteobacteria bacterium]|nr:AbrB/MazE/SpoVT family DNA-binding domain-containing protein [Pseudomonadota bacterium]